MQRKQHRGQHQRDRQPHARRHAHLAEARQQHHHGADAREHQDEGGAVGRQEGDVELHRSPAVRVYPPMMRAASRVMWPCSTSPMNGSATSIATKIARIFGTKTSVISWICVSACNSEIDDADDEPDQHQRRRDQHQRDDRIARNIENFRSGHAPRHGIRSASA